MIADFFRFPASTAAQFARCYQWHRFEATVVSLDMISAGSLNVRASLLLRSQVRS
jgi:hypothetical protein